MGIRCSACCRSCKRHICSNQWSILFISAPIAVVLFNGNHLDTMKEVTWHSLNTRLSGNVLETTYYSKVPGVNSLRSRTMVYYDIQYGLYYRQVPLSIHDQHDQTETHYADSKFNYTRRIRLLTIFESVDMLLQGHQAQMTAVSRLSPVTSVSVFQLPLPWVPQNSSRLKPTGYFH